MRIPLPAKELFALGPGDRFVVYWAKDDNELDTSRGVARFYRVVEG